MGRPENAPKDEGIRKSGIFLKLVPWSKRKYTIAQIDDWIRMHVPSTKDVAIIITTPLTERLQEALSGIAVGGSLAIKIFGNNQHVLDENGVRLYAMLSKIQGIQDLYIEQTKSAPGIAIDINRAKLGIYGMTPQQVGGDIQTALAGRVSESTNPIMMDATTVKLKSLKNSTGETRKGGSEFINTARCMAVFIGQKRTLDNNLTALTALIARPFP